MKRRWILVVISFIVMTTAAFFAACDGNESRNFNLTYETVTIRFEDRDYIGSQTVAKGLSVYAPYVPTRKGYEFVGWKENDTYISFPFTATADKILIAEWKEISSYSSGEVSGEPTDKIILSFDILYGDNKFSAKTELSEGQTIAEAIGNIDELTTLLEENDGYISSVTYEGQIIETDFIPSESMALEITVENCINVNLYVLGAKIAKIEHIGGQTLSAVKNATDTAALMTTEINGAKVSLGRITGWYSNSSLTTALQDDSIIKNKQNIYCGCSFTTSAYSLKANIDVTLPDGTKKIYDARQNNLSTLGNLVAEGKTDLEVEWKYNNVSKIHCDNKDYISDEDNYYCLKINGSAEHDTSVALNGTISVVNEKLTYTNPLVEIYGYNKTQIIAKLKSAVKEYVATESFSSEIISAKTTQARVPMMYIKYLDYNPYTTEVINSFKSIILDLIPGIINGGKIDDSIFTNSEIKKNGWSSYIDYLFSFGLAYNQYSDALIKSGKSISDNEYTQFIPLIKEYLDKYTDYYLISGIYTSVNGLKSALISMTEIGQDDGPTVNGFIADITQKITELKTLECDDKLVSALDWIEENLYRVRFTGRENLKNLFTQKISDAVSDYRVSSAFGYSYYGEMLATYYNLNIADKNNPAFIALVENQLSTYKLNEDGSRKESTGCNWVGFSGGPLIRAMLRNEDGYDVEYEKSQQGYYPFEDKGMTQQGLSKLINFDRLYDYYNHKLNSSSGVNPRFALMTMIAHGIDPENYKKAVETENTENTYNIFSLWLEGLSVSEEGEYKITGMFDLAVAISYLAMRSSVEAPHPLGYIYQMGCIELG